MADKAHALTDNILKVMERRLSAIYSKAIKELEKTADEFFDQFTKEDAQKRKLLSSGKITKKNYQDWRLERVIQSERYDALKKQYAEQLLHVNETAVAYINGRLPEVYALNYNALAPLVNGVGGYSFTLTDAQTIKNLSLEDGSLLPYKKMNPAKDIPWNMKNINAEILQGILQGDSIPKISRRLLHVEEMNEKAAVRTARTIVTGAENKGRQDSYKKAENDGIILKREWIATHDGRTRDWHRELDGKLADVEKPFSNSLGLIMYPGDPGAHPANVYN